MNLFLFVRNSLGIGQEALAQLLDVHHSTLKMAEKGHRTLPPAAMQRLMWRGAPGKLIKTSLKKRPASGWRQGVLFYPYFCTMELDRITMNPALSQGSKFPQPLQCSLNHVGRHQVPLAGAPIGDEYCDGL